MQVYAKIDTPRDDNNNNNMMTDENLRVRIIQFYRWYRWGGASRGIIMFYSAFIANKREREREKYREIRAGEREIQTEPARVYRYTTSL